MRVYLTGFMGSGKSTLGQSLASALSYRFVDLDEQIVKKEGLSISEIFETKGEAYFRVVESDVLQSITGDKLVIALGGGTFCSDENIAFIKKTGISFYLYLNEDELLTRLSELKDGKRPLLNGLDKAGIQSLINDKLRERKDYYLQADYTVDGTLSVESLVKLIKHQLK